ncbi:MAG TPA: hypothetical protein VFP56_08595 [Candidatus Limnocylindrales bacterium]|nr:hypothetical protein [Candidatus Limnocylindrales bacterium]
MTAERDTTRIVRSWLRADEHESADRVLLSVLARLDATPQRRSVWPARRFASMNRVTQVSIAAAAVLVVAVLGINLLPRLAGTGAQSPAPTARASAGTSPMQSIAAAPTQPPAMPTSGSVPTGRYTWSGPTDAITLRVQPGWTAIGGGAALAIHAATSQEVTFDSWFPDSAHEVTRVYADACQSNGALVHVGPSPENLVTALVNQAGTDVVAGTRGSITSGTILSGQPVQRVVVTASPGLDLASCDIGGLQIWANTAETGFLALRPNYSAVVWIIDVGGERLIFTSVRGPEADPDDIGLADGLVASMKVVP